MFATRTYLSLMLGATRREGSAIELLADLLLHSNLSIFFDFLFKDADILHIIHPLNNLHPLHTLDTAPVP